MKQSYSFKSHFIHLCSFAAI